MTAKKNSENDITAAEPMTAYASTSLSSLASLVSGDPQSEDLTDLNIIALIRRGLDKKTVYRIAGLMGISIEVMCSLVHLSPRTLQRKKEDEYLGPLVSEHTITLARILIHGVAALGSLTGFQAWLKAPRAALGGLTPLSLMDTAVGCELVDEVLGRIEHGVHS